MRGVLIGCLLLAASRAASAYLGLPEVYGGAQGIDADEIAISPDGTSLYAAARFVDGHAGGGVAIYARDPASGTLVRTGLVSGDPAAPIGTQVLAGADAIAVSPDGANVYVGAEYVGNIVTFARDATTGALTQTSIVGTQDGIVGVDGIKTLALSPDGRHLYASGSVWVVVFERDAVTGALRHVERTDLIPGSGTRFGLSLAVSPDGANVYVAEGVNGGNDALVVYRRDAATGHLDLVQELKDGVQGYVALADFDSVAISPDGRNVYAGTFSDDVHLVVFARDAADGRLTVAQRLEAPEFAFESQSVAVASDGRTVYAGSGDRLTILARDPATGLLTLLQTFETPATPGISYIEALAPGPEGRDLYTGATRSHAVTHFRRTCGDGVVDDGEACDDGNLADADGCSAVCVVEPCFACTGGPSACTPTDGATCDDGNACTIGETCADGTCGGGAPVADGAACDDGDACTADDACAAGRCASGTSRTCGACEQCDRRHGCVGMLINDCDETIANPGGHGLLRLTHTARGATFAYTFVGGAKERHRDYPDPAVTDYALCVLDYSGLDPLVRRRAHVVLAASIPAGARCGDRPCWTSTDSDYTFDDPSGRYMGIRRVSLPTAAGGKRSITFDGRGRRVALGSLPVQPIVTAQVVAGDRCWRTFYQPYVTVNSETKLRARGGLVVP